MPPGGGNKVAALILSHRSPLSVHSILLYLYLAQHICNPRPQFLFYCAVRLCLCTCPPALQAVPKCLTTVSQFHSHFAGRKLVFSKRPVLLLKTSPFLFRSLGKNVCLRLFITSTMNLAACATLHFLYPFLFQISRQCWCQRFSTRQNMADALQCSHLSS